MMPLSRRHHTQGAVSRRPMDDIDRTFQSEVSLILDEFERRRSQERDARDRNKEEWRATVHDFRELARRCIVPTLRQIKEPLRRRGLRPYVTNNTRQGLNIWLEVDAEQLKPTSLVFRLDPENRIVEIDGLMQDDKAHQLEIPMDAFDQGVVEMAVVAFLRQLP